jgi:hypothetical protein
MLLNKVLSRSFPSDDGENIVTEKITYLTLTYRHLCNPGPPCRAGNLRA